MNIKPNMNLMRGSFIACCIIILHLTSFSQDFGLRPHMTSPSERFVEDDRESGLNPRKTAYTVSFSSAYTGLGDAGSFFTTSVAPSASFRATGRLTVRTGLVLTKSFSHLDEDESAGFYFTPGNQAFSTLWISGDYRLSKELSLTGTAYKQFSVWNAPSGGMQTRSIDNEGVMMNIRFTPTDRFKIDAGIEYHRGNYPLYHPYPRPVFGGYGPFPYW